MMVAVPSSVMAILALSGYIQNVFIMDISYVMASYAFVITVIWAVKILRRLWTWTAGRPLAKKILRHPLCAKYIKEMYFRMKISLFNGAFINLLYAGIKLFAGICYRSFWLIMLALYYMLLVAMRLSLLSFARGTEKAGENPALEWEKYRQCGIMLLFMNQILTGIVVFVVVRNRNFEYRGALIYTMALYSFYAVIMSVRNMIKVRKYASPVMAAARVLNTTAAIVSMLSLETAMLARFGEPGDVVFRRVLLSIAGGLVCLIVLGMAVYMIVRSTTQLKKLKKENQENNQ